MKRRFRSTIQVVAGVAILVAMGFLASEAFSGQPASMACPVGPDHRGMTLRRAPGAGTGWGRGEARGDRGWPWS